MISKQEKIFIAGAEGMVGSSIVRALKKAGYQDERFGGKILTPNRNQLDLFDEKKVKKWFDDNRPSIVILAAAKVGGILANSTMPADFILQNLKIQTNVIESAWKYGCKRLLFLGSSCIYPKNSKQPIKEEYLLSDELEQTNEYYAIAKIAGIKLCQALREQYKFDAISLMPTNLYGPRDNYHPENSHVIASLIMKFINAKKNCSDEVICWGTGSPLREFLHVDDLASAALFVLENWYPDKKNAPIDQNKRPLTYLNVGSGEEISIKGLSFKIAEILNYKGKIIWDNTKPDGTPRKRLNIDQISSLGWQPKISLDEGIKKTIDELKLE